MPIQNRGDCGQVCAEIRSRLEKMDLLTVQQVSHGPLWEALDQCVLVRKEDLQKLHDALNQGDEMPTPAWKRIQKALGLQ